MQMTINATITSKEYKYLFSFVLGFHYQVEISTGSKLFSDTVGTVKVQLIGEEDVSELVQLKE